MSMIDFGAVLSPYMHTSCAAVEGFYQILSELTHHHALSLLRGLSEEWPNEKKCSEKLPAPTLLHGFPTDLSIERADFEKCRESYAEMICSLRDSSALNWDLDILPENPCLALLSWNNAYERYMDEAVEIPPDSFAAFHQSTLYLLSTLIPGTYGALFCPVEICKLLYDGFFDVVQAHFALFQLYPARRMSMAEDKQSLPVVVYNCRSYLSFELNVSSDTVFPDIYDLFESYTERISGKRYVGEDDNPLWDAVESLSYQLTRDSVRLYYAPFYCTKALEYLCFSDEGKQYLSIGALDDGRMLNQLIEQILYKEDSFVDLFSNHKRKVPDDQPLIAFMSEVVSRFYMNGSDWLYESDRTYANWYLFSLYGFRRCFSNPLACSRESGLFLPALMQRLFCPCDQNDIMLETDSILAFYDRRLLTPTRVMSQARFDEIGDDYWSRLQKCARESNELIALCTNESGFWRKYDKGKDTAIKAENPLEELVTKWVDSIRAEQDVYKASLPLLVRAECIRRLIQPAVGHLKEYAMSLLIPNKIFEIVEKIEPMIGNIAESADINMRLQQIESTVSRAMRQIKDGAYKDEISYMKELRLRYGKSTLSDE